MNFVTTDSRNLFSYKETGGKRFPCRKLICICVRNVQAGDLWGLDYNNTTYRHRAIKEINKYRNYKHNLFVT